MCLVNVMEHKMDNQVSQQEELTVFEKLRKHRTSMRRIITQVDNLLTEIEKKYEVNGAVAYKN